MTGHIRRRGAASWELKFDVGRDQATGKREIRYQSFKGSKREAQAKLTELLTDAARGTLVDASKETLGAFADRWDRDWATHNVSPKTVERYRQFIANQIKPHLGAMPVQKIKPVNLTAFYATLLRSGNIAKGPLASRTVGHIHRLLRRMLGHAAQWGVIAGNPVALVHPPRVDQDEIEIIREDEIKVVLDALRTRNLPLYAIATLALATGARRGELCALRWKDLDLDTGKVRIEQSLEQTRAGLRFKAHQNAVGASSLFRARWLPSSAPTGKHRKSNAWLSASAAAHLMILRFRGGMVRHASQIRCRVIGCARAKSRGGGSICMRYVTHMHQA
jgi:integrase